MFSGKPQKPDYDLSSELEFEEYAPQLRQLRPRLRPDAQPIPQVFRGRTWFVLQDPVTLQFYRIGQQEREILDQFDGRTTLGEIHERLKARLGDKAPPFRELAQFAFMLRHANLTAPEAAEESRWHVERAAKKRRARLRDRLANFMYLTIPLLDPERFLARVVPRLRWIFTKPVFALWLATLGAALLAACYNARALAEPANGILAIENLGYLYAAFVLVKALHEIGHAVAAKHYGAEIHRMGIMFLIFMPCPYVDVTPVWSLPSKWQKVIVGSAGMMTELFVASLALFGWLAIEPGPLRSILYNVIFIASVSSILFNGNPLLRYDAYYILADWIEIPNLRQRSSEYIWQVLRRKVIGEKVPLPEATPREKAWFICYGLLAGVYRAAIAVGIILYIASKLFILGLLMAAVVAALWVVTPLVKLVRYCLYARQTRPVRARAAGVLLGSAAVLALLFGALPVSEAVRCPCALEPAEQAILRAEWPGFLKKVLVKDGEQVRKGQLLAVMENETLDAQIAAQEARLRATQLRLRTAEAEDPAAAQAEALRLGALQKDLDYLLARRRRMNFTAPFDGYVIAPDIERASGRFLELGEPVCIVASLKRQKVCAVVSNAEVPAVSASRERPARIKFRADPARVYTGRIERVHPSATSAPPPAALTSGAGGPVLLDPRSEGEIRTLTPWYRVDVLLDPGADHLPAGTTGTARFIAGRRPIAAQAWLRLRRLLSRRFMI